MKQLTHILRKDVEHLWPVIAQVAIITALHAFYAIYAGPGTSFSIGGPWGVLALFVSLSFVMLPLAIGAMTAVVIQEEPLVGSNAFWLTRPYSRSVLLVEKAAFLALCVLVPLILHDVFIVAWFGLGSVAAIPPIAGAVIEVAAVLACVAAIAVLTQTFARFTAVAFAVVIASWLLSALLQHSTNNFGPLAGIPGLFAAVIGAFGASVVIVHQYSTRRTKTSALIGTASLIAVVLTLSYFPWNAAWALRNAVETPVAGLDQVQVMPTLDATGASMPSDSSDPLSRLTTRSIAYAFRVSGLPPGITLETFRVDGEMQVGSARFPLGLLSSPRFGRGAAATNFVHFGPDQAFDYDRNANLAVALTGRLYFQVYRDLPSVRIPRPQHEATEWMGREKCVVSSSGDPQGDLHVWLACAELEPASGMHVDAALAGANGAPWDSNAGKSTTEADNSAQSPALFPAMFNPVLQTVRQFRFRQPAENAILTLTPREPAGLISRDFRIRAARLRDLETADLPRP